MTTAEISALSFEDALKELETIVKRLENGQSTLDQAIGDYERGSALKRHCEGAPERGAAQGGKAGRRAGWKP